MVSNEFKSYASLPLVGKDESPVPEVPLKVDMWGT